MKKKKKNKWKQTISGVEVGLQLLQVLVVVVMVQHALEIRAVEHVDRDVFWLLLLLLLLKKSRLALLINPYYFGWHLLYSTLVSSFLLGKIN